VERGGLSSKLSIYRKEKDEPFFNYVWKKERGEDPKLAKRERKKRAIYAAIKLKGSLFCREGKKKKLSHQGKTN